MYSFLLLLFIDGVIQFGTSGRDAIFVHNTNQNYNFLNFKSCSKILFPKVYIKCRNYFQYFKCF